MTPIALLRPALAALCLALPLAGAAQESTIRKNLGERVPALSQIDEISKTAMPGLFEVRVGTDVLYTDAEGNFLLHGNLLDTRNGRNLTEERMDKLLAVDFKTLNLKHAITMVRGNGKRKLAVFEDPNCGYCKRFEKDLQKIDNVTVHLFLLPILGEDSVTKSRQIWCAADKAKSWNDWMLDSKEPEGRSDCDTTAVRRTVELGSQLGINGTPTLFFIDGERIPGAVPLAQIEKKLEQLGNAKP